MNDRLAGALTKAREIQKQRVRVVRKQARARKAAPCAGYIFEMDGRAKVGISRHPDVREMEISMAAGKWVTLTQLLWSKDRSGALEWEARAHLELKHAHLLGEWFEGAVVATWLQQQPIGPGKPSTVAAPSPARHSRAHARLHKHALERAA